MSRNVDDITGLSRLYHLNSEPWVNEQQGPKRGFVQQTKSDPNAARIALPVTPASAFDDLSQARRSARAFDPLPMPIADLAALLHTGYRAIGPDTLESGQRVLRRPAPSAGALYPLEIYVLVRNVEDLAKGVYHYDAVGDALERVCEGDWEDSARAAFLTWQCVEDAPVILCIAGVFARSQVKYGPRGYRYVLLEAGHVAQNLCLAATEANIGSLCMGGFYDGVLNGLVGLDGLEEAVVYTVALGRIADQSTGA